jgi:hypothetical protein
MTSRAVVLIAVAVLFVPVAFAQPPQPPMDGPMMQPGMVQPGMAPGGPGGFGAGGGPMGRMMMMPQQPAPAIAVADGFVFVVFGNTLFQFTVDGLKQVAQAQLQPQQPKGPPPPPGTIKPMPGEGTTPPK